MFASRQENLDITRPYTEAVNTLSRRIMAVESQVAEILARTYSFTKRVTARISAYTSGERMLQENVGKAEAEMNTFQGYLTFQTDIGQSLTRN